MANTLGIPQSYCWKARQAFRDKQDPVRGGLAQCERRAGLAFWEVLLKELAVTYS